MLLDKYEELKLYKTLINKKYRTYSVQKIFFIQ